MLLAYAYNIYGHAYMLLWTCSQQPLFGGCGGGGGEVSETLTYVKKYFRLLLKHNLEYMPKHVWQHSETLNRSKVKAGGG